HPPVVDAQDQAMEEGKRYEFRVSGSDPDTGQTVSVHLKNCPPAKIEAGGMADCLREHLPTGASFGSSSGIFKWMPAPNQAGAMDIESKNESHPGKPIYRDWNGIYLLTFVATDGYLKDEKTIQITV